MDKIIIQQNGSSGRQPAKKQIFLAKYRMGDSQIARKKRQNL